MSAAVVTGYGIPIPAIQGKVEFGGSVSVELPDGVTARVVGNAIVVNGTYDGVVTFLGRCAALRFQLILDNARRRLGWR